jgi:hypothetical protein
MNPAVHVEVWLGADALVATPVSAFKHLYSLA